MSYLAADHDRLGAMLADVCSEMEAGRPETAAERYAAFDSGLTRHIRIEEELVFPFFELRSGLSGGPTAVMREEHRIIQNALGLIREALAARDERAFRAGMNALGDVLPEHREREERVLYPITDRMLSASERDVFVQWLKQE